MIYPFTSPQVLTDEIFVAYGGQTGTTTVAQRQAAYFVAEKWMSDEIGTLLVETTVTGTYYYPQHGDSIVLDYAYVSDVKAVRFLDTKGSAYYTITGTSNYYAAVRNYERGILDVFSIIGYYRTCGCVGPYYPYQMEVAFTAGLPTGTYTSPNMLMALSQASQIVLDEFLGVSGETFSGITEFRNQQYSEKRLQPIVTAFGASPKAQFIKSLIDGFIRLQVVGL